MNKIMIAMDGSAASDAALRSGLELAASENAAVIFVHVAPELDVVPGGMFGTTAALRHEPSSTRSLLLPRRARLRGLPQTGWANY